MTTTLKIKSFLCFLIFGLSVSVQADTASLTRSGDESSKLSAPLTDFVRENLIHIFDSSNFHQMKGGDLPSKTQKQIEKQLKKVKSGSYIELKLDESARIVVEGTDLKVMRMWVSIRESDGFVFDWILQQPNGELVSLAKPRGELVTQFAPHVLNLLKSSKKQAVKPDR